MPIWNDVKLKLSDPRKMMIVAALLAALGLVMNYVQVQDHADRTLALRLGAPPAVALQAFDPKINIGPAREVVLRAEADLSDPLILTLRGVTPAKRAVVIPLYPLSDIGATLIEARLDQGSAALGAQVARRAQPLSQEPDPLGVILHILPPGAETANLAVPGFGAGRFGTVIELNGQRLDPGPFGPMIDGAMAAQGKVLPASYVAVAPFVTPRAFALAPGAGSAHHRIFFGAALLLALLAAVISFRQDPEAERRAQIAALVREDAAATGTAPQRSAKFAPLPMQEDIAETPPAPPSALRQAARKLGMLAKAKLLRS